MKKLFSRTYKDDEGTTYILEKYDKETIIFCHETGVAIPTKIINYMISDFLHVEDESDKFCSCGSKETIQAGDCPAGKWWTECAKCGKKR